MNTQKQDIRKLSIEEIKAYCTDNDFKSFRAKQIYEWLWKRGARSFEEMNNLPLNVRNSFTAKYSIYPMQVFATQKSKDGTIKTAFEMHDGGKVEGVMIPSGKRATACISSQIGCNLACRFCATGKLNFARNLGPGEIYDQVVTIQRQAEAYNQSSLTNIVLMGMGEPLLNYKNVNHAIQHITSQDGLGMSPKRITLSTSGIIKGIKQLADDQVKFNLAISLHSADAEKRNFLMPVNENNPLPELANAIQYFYKKTGTRISYEYLLLKDFNDSIEDAKKLAAFCKITPCKVNLIEFNPTGDGQFNKSSKANTESFYNFIESKNMVVNIRNSRGEDIDAACGQLANKVRNKSA